MSAVPAISVWTFVFEIFWFPEIVSPSGVARRQCAMLFFISWLHEPPLVHAVHANNADHVFRRLFFTMSIFTIFFAFILIFVTSTIVNLTFYHRTLIRASVKLWLPDILSFEHVSQHIAVNDSPLFCRILWMLCIKQELHVRRQYCSKRKESLRLRASVFLPKLSLWRADNLRPKVLIFKTYFFGSFPLVWFYAVNASINSGKIVYKFRP